MEEGKVLRFDDKAVPMLSIPMGNVPVEQWEIWNDKCKKFYNGNRWVMVWNEHTKAEAYDCIVNLLNQYGVQEVNHEPDVKVVEKETNDNELGLLNGGK